MGRTWGALGVVNRGESKWGSVGSGSGSGGNDQVELNTNLDEKWGETT